VPSRTVVAASAEQRHRWRGGLLQRWPRLLAHDAYACLALGAALKEKQVESRETLPLPACRFLHRLRLPRYLPCRAMRSLLIASETSTSSRCLVAVPPRCADKMAAQASVTVVPLCSSSHLSHMRRLCSSPYSQPSPLW